MPLAGDQWLPRDVLRLLWDNHWKDANVLMTMGCVVYAESSGYEHAWHYNTNGTTDWGMFQLNDQNVGGGPPDSHGNPVFKEGQKLTQDQVIAFKDMAWDAHLAAMHARVMFVDRGFQPWYAYTNMAYRKHIATFCKGMCNFLAVLNGLQPIVG